MKCRECSCSCRGSKESFLQRGGLCLKCAKALKKIGKNLDRVVYPR